MVGVFVLGGVSAARGRRKREALAVSFIGSRIPVLYWSDLKRGHILYIILSGTRFAGMNH